MKRRRKLLIALGASVLTSPLPLLAQQQGKVWRIGYLSPRLGIDAQDEGFQLGLRELGYIEGKNIIIEWRFAKGRLDLLPGLAKELANLKLDCIITAGMDTTRAAKLATNTIPIVMVNVNDDPVRHGLVASLAHPGGNVTGGINMGSELAGKRLELLKETLPKASRVALLWDINSLPATGHVRETKAAARVLGMQLQLLEVRDPGELENAFREAGRARAQALIVVGVGSVNSHRGRIVSLAVKARLPAMYTNSLYVMGGGLMSYAVDGPDQYRRAATTVDKILKGTKPTDLPVVQPTKFEFIVNLKAAKQIGLTIPPNVLARADKIIE